MKTSNMMFVKLWKERGKKAQRDLLAVIFVTIIALQLLIVTDFHDRYYEFTRHVERWEIDELIYAVFVFGFALAWFSYRRWQEVNAEFVAHLRAEEALRESEMRFREMAEHINEGFWLEPADSPRLLYHNPAHKALWGRATDTGLADSRLQLDAIHPEDRAHVMFMLEKKRRGEAFEVEYRLLRPDAAVRHIRDRGFPVLNEVGAIYRFAGISEDVTAHKQMEEQIRSYTQELERLVAERTARIKELEHQHAESEKLAAIGRMAAGVAHEINNPLAGINGAITLIKKETPSTQKHYQYFELIEREITRISGIIEHMYMLYQPRVETPRAFELDRTIGDIVTLFQTRAQAQHLVFQSEAERLAVTLPENSIRQVLYNLLQNAVDASPPGSRIKVSATTAAEQVRIAVADQGAGIPDELRERVFEPFFTTKSPQQKNRMGLGLALCKSIAESLGGTLDFETALGQGTVFHVKLPMARVAMAVC